MNYTIISGTNRPSSNSIKVSKYYQDKFKAKGIDTQIVNLEELSNECIFSNMYGKRTEEFESIQEIISATNKFLFVIPEYNGSFPGVLKSFIDACEFPASFAHKKCAMVGLSSGKFGNLRGIEHFAGVANYIKMNVCQNMVYLSGIDSMIKDGEFNVMDNESYIESQIDEFMKF